MENGAPIKAKRIEKRRRIKMKTSGGGEEKKKKGKEEGEKEERKRQGRRNESWMAIQLTKHLNKVISHLDSNNHPVIITL